jgi:hypothetical protein
MTVSNTDQDTGGQLFQLANKVLGLIALVIGLLAVIVIGLLVFYGVLLTQDPNGAATNQLKTLIVDFWGQVVPSLSQFMRLVAPVFVLIFALGVLQYLARQGATPFDAARLLADLPSALALLIIATICLLPLAGIGVPDVLNNIALVVVGFYFGKRKTSDEGG